MEGFNAVFFNTSMMNGTFPRPPFPEQVIPSKIFPEFKKYGYTITSILGLIGNAIIFYIFTRTKLKKPSTSRYLAAAAIADNGFLLTTFLTVLHDQYQILVRNFVGSCQLITFGNHVFQFLANWYLTAVIIEKYIGVTWPRKKARMCTVFRAKCVVICLAIMGTVCYLYITYFFGVTPYGCSLFFGDPRIKSAWQVLTRMDAIVNFAVPYIIIFILTCLIAYRTYMYHKMSLDDGESFLRRRRVTTPIDKEFKTTPLLILLATCTLIFCTPNSSSSLRRIFSKGNLMITAYDLKVMAVFLYLQILNCSVKIVVYIAASNAFVRELGKLFCKIPNRWKKKDSVELQNSHVPAKVESLTTKNVATSTEGIV